MIALVSTLLGLPLLAAVVLAFVGREALRDVIVRAASVLLIVVSIAAFVIWHHVAPVRISVNGALFPLLFFAIDVVISGYVVYLSIVHRKYITLVLTVVQFVLLIYFEFFTPAATHAASTFYVDDLSLVMILVAGVIGSLIAFFSVGYMKSYHHLHSELVDRRKLYYFLLFLFLSAMLGLVLANDLAWLFFFWEITTFCSFMLIGYSREKQAIDNSFLAIRLNLIGGVAFILSIIYLRQRFGVVDMTGLLAMSKPLALLPVALLAVAGLTKAALLPFSSWLLGAMVAPTTVSALLHSSTMVKAGVYLLLRVAPMMTASYVGYGVTLVGGITFLVTSILAIAQSDAKRILAYSTIANLGLIAACAGIGNYELLWVGIFIIIFHAVAKSLLFLSMGVVGYKLHSVDIEDQDNLVVRYPMLTMLMVIGIGGMFIAPFGMLISKWAALVAFINLTTWISPVMVFCLAYGSAATILFWTKWMGKMISVNRARWPIVPDARRISFSEWSGLWVLGGLTVAVVLLFPLLSSHLVSPYVHSVFGVSVDMESGNYVITAVMVGLILLIPGFLLLVPRKTRSVVGPVYMAGRETDAGLAFKGSLGQTTALSLKNYYLGRMIKEKVLTRVGTAVGIALTICIIGASFV